MRVVTRAAAIATVVTLIAPGAFADTYALLVACGKGNSWAMRGLPQLAGPRTDLALWQDMLACYVPARHLHAQVLTSDEANRLPTLAQVRAKFEWLENRVVPDDTVLIAFSSHAVEVADIVEDVKHGIHMGTEEHDMNCKAILLYDSDPANPATCLIDHEIAHHLNRIHSRRILCLFDTCHSKGIERGPWAWLGLANSINRTTRRSPAQMGPIILAATDTWVPELKLSMPSGQMLTVSPCTLFMWRHVLTSPGISFHDLSQAILFDYQYSVCWKGERVTPSVYGNQTVDFNQPFLWAHAPHVHLNMTIRGIRLTRRTILHMASAFVDATSQSQRNDNRGAPR